MEEGIHPFPKIDSECKIFMKSRCLEYSLIYHSENLDRKGMLFWKSENDIQLGTSQSFQFYCLFGSSPILMNILVATCSVPELELAYHRLKIEH